MGRPKLNDWEIEGFRLQICRDLGPVARLIGIRQWCKNHGRKRKPSFIVRDARFSAGNRGLYWLGRPDADVAAKERGVKAFLENEKRERERKMAERAGRILSFRSFGDPTASVLAQV